MNKRLVAVILLVAVTLVFGAIWLVPRNMFLMSMVEHSAPGLISSSNYARNLDSKDPDLVRESLAHLTDRRDPIAVTRAVGLLQSTDDYIWLNAAHYVGVCGRQEAVPYLIKALRHTAWRADNATAQYLRQLTGQDFGTDFPRWQQWWLGLHPDSAMDWASHLGFSPRLAASPPGVQPEVRVRGTTVGIGWDSRPVSWASEGSLGAVKLVLGWRAGKAFRATT
jgi:hypothetical protein